MQKKWVKINKISSLAKEHSFLAMCGFCVLICILVCFGFAINYLFDSSNQAAQLNKVPNEDYTVAIFQDSTFETAVRIALDRPYGDLYEEELAKIETLKIKNEKHLADIEDIRLFPNLKYLKITNCSIMDVSSLSSLDHVEKLNLSNNKIRDFSALCDLKYLKKLDLSENNISKVPSTVKNLYYLEELTLSDNRISDISPLADNANLEMLDLSENCLTEIPEMNGLESLTILSFEKNSISKVASLNGLASLEELNIAENLLTNLDFIKNNKVIKTLDISYNDMKDIAALSTCSNLESLTLHGEQDFDLTPLQSLERFNSIYLDTIFNRANIDFMIGNFKDGDKETRRYLVAHENNIDLSD